MIHLHLLNLILGLEIRLVGGASFTEGRVEIFVDNGWGTVCDHEFDIDDVTVVCKQLGFRKAEKVLPGAYFGKGNGTIKAKNPDCNGDESSLTECKASLFSHLYKCEHSEDASVRCSGEILILIWRS